MKTNQSVRILFCLILSTTLFIGSSACDSDTKRAVENLLATTGWLAEHLDDPNLVIIDARAPETYEAGHIPNAINVQWGALSEGEIPLNLLPTGELETVLGDLGITGSETIVVYTKVEGSWGADGRIFWTLEYMGHPDVHILDGGWAEWEAIGGDVETTVNLLPAAAYTSTPDPTVYATHEYMVDRYQDPGVIIVDSRTQAEYDGAQLYGEERGGHIPGAVNLDYDDYFEDDWTLVDLNTLQGLYVNLGITGHEEVIFNCTAGIRSAYAYFTLRLLGYPQTRNYDGSWYAWAADLSLPVE